MCHVPRSRPAAWTRRSTSWSAISGRAVRSYLKTSVVPYASWTMACIVRSAVVVVSSSDRMIVRPDRHAPTSDQEPQAEQELADERDRGDLERGLGENPAGAVERVAETGDDQEGTEEPGHVARSVGQVADEYQMGSEEDESGVPDVVERIDLQQSLCLDLIGSERARAATQQVGDAR